MQKNWRTYVGVFCFELDICLLCSGYPVDLDVENLWNLPFFGFESWVICETCRFVKLAIFWFVKLAIFEGSDFLGYSTMVMKLSYLKFTLNVADIWSIILFTLGCLAFLLIILWVKTLKSLKRVSSHRPPTPTRWVWISKWGWGGDGFGIVPSSGDGDEFWTRCGDGDRKGNIRPTLLTSLYFPAIL